MLTWLACPCTPGISPSSYYSEEQHEYVITRIWAEVGEINFFRHLLILPPVGWYCSRFGNSGFLTPRFPDSSDRFLPCNIPSKVLWRSRKVTHKIKFQTFFFFFFLVVQEHLMFLSVQLFKLWSIPEGTWILKDDWRK